MPEAIASPKRSTRDPEQTRVRLERWLRERLPEARIASLSSPSATGMSSETLLFDASWREDGAQRSASFVARVAPDPKDVPVFPTYDLEAQFRVMQIAARGGVPAPNVRWLELDAAQIGSPFFVMDRASGRVPPDIMPYTMGSWLSEASRADQQRLQDATVAVIAKLHAIDPDKSGAGFLAGPPGTGALRAHFEGQRRFYDWMRQSRRYPLLERTFAWLEERWPDDAGDTVISWGDSRIGNVLYDGFTPAAVLDWEMAALGPRGLDLGWLAFLHAFFSMIARGAGLPGMPRFLRAPDVMACYERASGVKVGDLRWYEAYAALRHGVIMARIHARAVHFGEATWPEDLDATIAHRPLLEQMLAGSYWRAEGALA